MTTDNAHEEVRPDQALGAQSFDGGEDPIPDLEPVHDEFQPTGEIRILVLDDDPLICRLIKNTLTYRRFRVETENDPAKMLERLKSPPYDLIILDYLIPGLNFEDMLNSLQQEQPHASVIVVTGYPSLDSALHCLRARLYDYVTKPFEIGALEKTVLRCLDSKGLLRLSEHDLLEKLGAAIRERRKALKLTLADLAKRADLSVGYLSQIELGKNSASVETLYRVSLGLSIRLADLFHGIQPKI
jgi:DNA-binding response OmpR family regulator